MNYMNNEQQLWDALHETRRRLDDAWLEIEQLKKDRELLKRQRDDAWKEIKRLTKGMEKWT